MEVCIKAIVEYDKYVNGVHKCNCCKSITRWKKVFVRLLQLAVVNKIIIYHTMKPQLILKHQGHKKLGKTNTPICSTVGRSKCE